MRRYSIGIQLDPHPARRDGMRTEDGTGEAVEQTGGAFQLQRPDTYARSGRKHLAHEELRALGGMKRIDCRRSLKTLQDGPRAWVTLHDQDGRFVGVQALYKPQIHAVKRSAGLLGIGAAPGTLILDAHGCPPFRDWQRS